MKNIIQELNANKSWYSDEPRFWVSSIRIPTALLKLHHIFQLKQIKFVYRLLPRRDIRNELLDETGKKLKIFLYGLL